MANVKFLRGLYADYSNLTPKDADTLYITGASQGSYDSIYLGANLLGTTSLGKLPFDWDIYNTTYNGAEPFTESNLSAATTLLDVIAVLENKIDNATGADHAVTSIYGMTGAVTFSNVFTADDGEAQYAHVVFVKNDSAKEIRGKLAIDASKLFGESEIVANTSETIENKDLIQIVTDVESGNITLAKVKALLANPEQKDSEDDKSFLTDGLMTMSTTAAYVKRVVSGQITSAFDLHKTERNAHKLENIEKLSTDASNNITTIINSTTDPVGSENYGISSGWNSISKYIDLETITDEITNSSNAEDVIEAMFKAFSKAIKGTIDVSTHYTDTQVASVAIEWGEIA